MAFLKRIWPYCDMSKTTIIDLWILCLANNGHVSLLMDHVQNQTTGCPITFIELWLTAKTYLLSLGFFLWLTFLSQCYFDKYLGLKYILTLPFAFKPFKDMNLFLNVCYVHGKRWKNLYFLFHYCGFYLKFVQILNAWNIFY